MLSVATIHNKTDFAGMRKAGQLAAETLDMIAEHVKPGVTTESLDKKCFEFADKNNACIAPLYYKGFPKSVCTSINHVICHGIPSSRVLEEGDIVFFPSNLEHYVSNNTSDQLRSTISANFVLSEKQDD